MLLIFLSANIEHITALVLLIRRHNNGDTSKANEGKNLTQPYNYNLSLFMSNAIADGV